MALLFLAALAIRLAIPRGLWLDEAISVHQAHLGLPELIQDLAGGDRHPPLHHLLLWVVMRTIGDGDLAMRLPSIAAGALLVPALYALGAALFDRRTGVVAALLAVLAPILVWYSQEARGYALEALFATLAVLGCVRIVQRGRPGDFALHAVASALAVWTHWFALLIVVASELVLLATLVRRRRLGEPVASFVRRWVLATAALLCQLVPLGVLAAAQVRATGTGGGYAGASSSGEGAISFYAIVSNGAWALFGFHPNAVTDVLSAVWPLLMLATLLLVGRGVSRCSALLLVCGVGPVLALLVLALRSPAVFDVRYFVAVVPLLLVLLA
ncbi:MAG TPA: glycosyltransferase family 39 protein, partial [Solirubrobacteraceae bacterium]|nr:glycosyltransferase family 39 protein [Solirubrobacteraceae bacterium]